MEKRILWNAGWARLEAQKLEKEKD